MHFEKKKSLVRLTEESPQESASNRADLLVPSAERQQPVGAGMQQPAGANTAQTARAGTTQPTGGKNPWLATWRRLGAVLLDGAILFLPFALIDVLIMLPQLGDNFQNINLALLLFGTALITFSGVPFLALALLPVTLIFMTPIWGLALGTFFGSEAVSWLYRAGLESSPCRATLGKKLFGLTVNDRNGNRASLWRTSARHLLKSLNLLTCLVPGVGFWLNSGQTLHDRVSGCSVAGAPPIVPPLPAALEGTRFAPLWRRAGAAIVDALLVVCIEMCVGSWLILQLQKLMQPADTPQMVLMAFISAPLYFIPLLLPMAMLAAFEWSRLQATPGKILFGLRVISPGGGRITFLSSLYKQFVQYALWLSMWPIWCASALFVGYAGSINPALAPGASTFLYGLWLAIYGAMLCVTFRGQVKQSLVDRIAHRFVVYRHAGNEQKGFIADQPGIRWATPLTAVLTLAFMVVSNYWYSTELKPHEAAAQKASMIAFFRESDVPEWKGGWLTAKGKLVVPPPTMTVSSFSENLGSAKQSGKWGFINDQGKWVVRPQFDRVGQFKDGVAPVGRKSKWGLIDKTGKLLITPQFDDIQPFSEGFAAARQGLYYGYIDKHGKWLVAPRLSEALPFANGFAAACLDDGSWTYIHVSGTMSKPRADEISTFSEGLAGVKQGDKWGYINTAGKWVIPPAYEFTAPFTGGQALVFAHKQSLIIDRKGLVLKAGKHLAAVKAPATMLIPAYQAGTWGYLNGSGKFVPKAKLSGLQPLVNNAAFASLKADDQDKDKH